MKLPYYPGCSLKTKAKHFETSALLSAKELGIDLIELPRWNCCGAVTSLTEDDLIHHTAPVTNLLRVQDLAKSGEFDDQRLVVLCSMCMNVLKRSNKRVKDSIEDRNKINDFLYLEENRYEGNVEVIHYLELIREFGFDNFKESIKIPLTNLKASPYYGCLLLRPKTVGIDDPEAPSIQENLLKSLGCDVINNPSKSKCCGSYHTINDKDLVVDLGYDILTQAERAGAEIITTSCPLCAFNLDNRQKDIKKQYPEFKTIPVVYFTELMCLALGLDINEAGLDKHFIDPRPLLKTKGVINE